ncbi:hypothetical protein KOR42_35850 [Thalassoglobus neptunius]|uniref:Uncharacterized protein n=1 Tax=Thalassoglobus neptunius TaxID=1938619 RepID=A0A5C5WLN4_9PLAN|nr:hypothetical protein [Thalassoglobus neptunius]TWT51537.1 hypothetical protein KOR42_35850 [Thalassoglobus neptunius]
MSCLDDVINIERMRIVTPSAARDFVFFDGAFEIAEDQRFVGQ